MITRLQFNDWRHILHHWKGNFHSFEAIFPQDQKSKYAPAKYELFYCSFISNIPRYFSFAYQTNTALPRRLWAPLTTIRSEIYNMRHSTKERPKESNLLVEKKKGGCPARFRAKLRRKKSQKTRVRNAFDTAYLFRRFFERTMAT